MSEIVLVEYRAGTEGLKSDLKTVQTEFKNTEKVGVAAADNTTKAFDKTEVATKSLKAQLKDLKAQLANATDPKEVERLARAAGKLTYQIEDATSAAKIFASGSKFEQVGNGLGNIFTKLRNLDFKGAASEAELLSSVVRSINFKDVKEAAKDFGKSMLGVAEAIIANPLVMYTALVAGTVAIVGKLIAKFSEENTLLFEQTQLYNKLVEVNKFLNAQDEARIKGLSGLKANEEEILRITEKKIQRNIDEAKMALQLSIIKQKAAQTETTYLEKIQQLLGNGSAVELARAARMQEANKGVRESYLALENGIADLSKFKNESTQKDLDNQKKAIDEALALDKLLRDLRTQNIQSDYERQKQVILNNFDDEATKHKGHNLILIELEKKKNSELEALWKEREAKYSKIKEDGNIDFIKKFKDGAKEIEGADTQLSSTLVNNMKGVADEEKKQLDIRKKLQQSFYSFMAETINAAKQISDNIAEKQLQDNEERSSNELKVLQNQFDKGIISKDEYERKKAQIDKRTAAEEAKIKRQQFETNKQIALINVIINTAQAVAKTIGELGFPAAIPFIALAAAQGALQIAVIESQPTPKFEKGGKVGGKRHSQGGTLLEAEKDEFIVNRKDAIKHDGLLTALNKGQAGKFIKEFYIAPALKEQRKKLEQQKEATFADSIMKSLAVNGKFYDGNLLDSLKQSRKADKENILFLAQKIESSQRSKHKW